MMTEQRLEWCVCGPGAPRTADHARNGGGKQGLPPGLPREPSSADASISDSWTPGPRQDISGVFWFGLFFWQIVVFFKKIFI